jgi:hypothetical protein
MKGMEGLEGLKEKIIGIPSYVIIAPDMSI